MRVNVCGDFSSGAELVCARCSAQRKAASHEYEKREKQYRVAHDGTRSVHGLGPDESGCQAVEGLPTAVRETCHLGGGEDEPPNLGVAKPTRATQTGPWHEERLFDSKRSCDSVPVVSSTLSSTFRPPHPDSRTARASFEGLSRRFRSLGWSKSTCMRFHRPDALTYRFDQLARCKNMTAK